jgi:hypothetical protein
MNFRVFPIPFMFSSKVTAEELDQSFLNTNTVSVFRLAEGLPEEDVYCTPAEAYGWPPFDESPDGNKYVSFMSRPSVPLDNNSQLCEMVFYEPKWSDGFQKYVAILSRTINSAPGNDTHWPYGRYNLIDIDGNVGAKFINSGLQSDFCVMQDDPGDNTSEVPWQKFFEFHKLNDNIRTFGLLLCNFKDQLDDGAHGTWGGLLRILTDLDESDDPTVDKVAVRQTAFQIVSNYITLRKNSVEHEQLAQDIQEFKDRLNFEEILRIKNSDFGLNLPPQYEWRRVCNALANMEIPELKLPPSITTTIVEDMFCTPHFGENGCFNGIAGYSLEMGTWGPDLALDESPFPGIDLAAYLDLQRDEDFFCYSDHGNENGGFGGFVVRTKGLLVSHQVFLNNKSQTFEFFNQYMAPYLLEGPESLFDHVIVLYSEYRRDFWILSTDPRSWDAGKPDEYGRLRIPEQYGIVGRWGTQDEDQEYNPRPLNHFDSPSYTPKLRAAAKYLESCLLVDNF